MRPVPYALAFLAVCLIVTVAIVASVSKGAGLLLLVTRLFPSTRAEILREGRQSRAAGFDPHGALDRLVGREGVLVTDARPVGKALLGGETVTIVARDGFMTRGTAVRAVGFQAGSLVVSPVEPAP